MVKGQWHKPVISGRNKAELKRTFEMCNVPWIYEEPRPLVHKTSAYNRKPKGSRQELEFESRIATIRKNLSTQETRLEKLRQDRYDNMNPKGLDRTLFMIMKSINVSAGKKQQTQ